MSSRTDTTTDTPADRITPGQLRELMHAYNRTVARYEEYKTTAIDELCAANQEEFIRAWAADGGDRRSPAFEAMPRTLRQHFLDTPHKPVPPSKYNWQDDENRKAYHARTAAVDERLNDRRGKLATLADARARRLLDAVHTLLRDGLFWTIGQCVHGVGAEDEGECEWRQDHVYLDAVVGTGNAKAFAHARLEELIAAGLEADMLPIEGGWETRVFATAAGLRVVEAIFAVESPIERLLRHSTGPSPIIRVPFSLRSDVPRFGLRGRYKPTHDSQQAAAYLEYLSHQDDLSWDELEWISLHNEGKATLLEEWREEFRHLSDPSAIRDDARYWIASRMPAAAPFVVMGSTLRAWVERRQPVEDVTFVYHHPSDNPRRMMPGEQFVMLDRSGGMRTWAVAPESTYLPIRTHISVLRL